MARFARLLVARRCLLLAGSTICGYSAFTALRARLSVVVDVSVACYLLLCVIEAFLSVSAARFIPDTATVPKTLNSDIRRVLSRLRRAITICPTISNIGFRTILGLPPAIATRIINMKRSRKICSIPASGDEIGVVIVSPPVTSEPSRFEGAG